MFALVGGQDASQEMCVLDRWCVWLCDSQEDRTGDLCQGLVRCGHSWFHCCWAKHSHVHKALTQLKPDVAVNRQVNYQETLFRDSSRLKCLNDPVLCTSSVPFGTPVVHSQVTVFPVSWATTDVLSQGLSQNAAQVCQVWEERDYVSETLFLHSLSATEHISFPLSFCWKLSIAGITAISYKNTKTDFSRQGWVSASQWSGFEQPPNTPPGFSLKSK